jgi:methionine synthase II (cobalamin-independent)
VSILYRDRAEVIGSLLRPAYLKEARRQGQAGTLATPEFKRVEDRAVDEAIALRERAGWTWCSDGEMRRTHFIAPLTDVISGVKEISAFKRVWRRPHAQGHKAGETEIQVQYGVALERSVCKSAVNEQAYPTAYSKPKAQRVFSIVNRANE